MLQDVGPDAAGTSGGDLGFSGFQPSFGVEFDTWNNADNNDLAADHIGMISNGSVAHPPAPTGIAGPVTATPTGGNIEDGQDHIVDIRWDPSIQQVTVSFDCQERLVASIDLIDDIFAGDRFVWWGFTAKHRWLVQRPNGLFGPQRSGHRLRTIRVSKSVGPVARGIGVTDYAWSPSNLVSDPTVYNPEYLSVVSNTLTVEYTDQYEDLQSEVIDVVVEDVAVTVDGNALTRANGGELNLVAESSFGTALTYEWAVNNVVVGDFITLDVFDAGTITLDAVYPGTSSLACQSQDQITVLWDTTAMDIDAGLPGLITCGGSHSPSRDGGRT